MTRWLEPVEAGVVGQEVAAAVISPPYDLLTPSQRASQAREFPRSFLNGTPSEGDDPSLDLAGRRQQAISYLQREIGAGTWRFLDRGLFVLRIESRGRTQTGVVGDVPVSFFPDLIRPHEGTRPARVEDLASYMASVGYFSSPVALTYRQLEEIDAIVEQVTQRETVLDVILPDGDRHRVWHVNEPDIVEALAGAFAHVGTAYIIDGHHRVAATLQRHEDPSTAEGRFLAVAFPHHDLQVYPFHRWVHGSLPVLNRRAAGLSPSPGLAVAVTREGDIEIDLGTKTDEEDVAALARTVLEPLLGVKDERTDPRIAFVPGFPGPEALRQLVEEQGGVGFLLAPTTIEAVMAVSDRGEVMPPKATFFAPKPRSGVFLVKR